jgi:hypothetical protein
MHFECDGLGIDAKTDGHQACGQSRVLQKFIHGLVSWWVVGSCNDKPTMRSVNDSEYELCCKFWAVKSG